MTWRQAWREADVRSQTSALPHLTVWRQAEQLSQDTGEVPVSLSNKTFSLPQTRYYECRLYLLGFPLLLPYD